MTSFPSISSKNPSSIFLEEGKKYFWCSCGLTQTPPFCDGTHKGSGFKSLMFEVPASQTYSLCNCKHTKTPPFCDGSHCSL